MQSEARTRLPTISGSIPHPYNRPPGCPFYPRCPDFMPGICNAWEPALVQVAARQEAACFLYDEVREASIPAEAAVGPAPTTPTRQSA